MLLLWEYIVDLVEVLLFYILISNKLITRKFHYRKLIVSIYFIFESGFIFWANRTDISSLIIIPSLFILHVISCSLLTQSETSTILIWCVAFLCISISADALTTVIPINIFHVDVSFLLYGGELRIPFTIIYLSIIAIMVIFLLCLDKKTFKLTLYDRILLLAITLLCVLIEEIILLHQLPAKTDVFISDNNFLYLVFFLIMLLFTLNIIMTVSGFYKNPLTAIQVLSEIGRNMSVFPTTKHLIYLAGRCPCNVHSNQKSNQPEFSVLVPILN